MKRLAPWLRWIGVAVLVLVGLGGAVELLLRSDWFERQLLARVSAELERAVGEASIGALRFDRPRLAVELDDLRIRGAGDGTGPALLEVPRVRLGLGVESLLGGRVRLRTLRFERPRVFLHTAPDGTTNLPSLDGGLPTSPRLNLAAGRAVIEEGVVEWDGERYDVSLTAEGVGLTAMPSDGEALCYDVEASSRAADWRIRDAAGRADVLALDALACGDRLDIREARVESDGATLVARGQARSFDALEAELDYELRAPLALLNEALPDDWRMAGMVESAGRVAAQGAFAEWEVTGQATLAGGRATAPTGVIGDIGARTSYRFDPRRASLTSLEVAALGGSLRGDVEIDEPFGARRTRFEGRLAGVRLRALTEAFSRSPLPWSSVVAGAIRLTASRVEPPTAEAELGFEAPAGADQAMLGEAALAYDGGSGAVRIDRLALRSGEASLTAAGSAGGPGGARIELAAEVSSPDDWLPLLESFGVETGDWPVRFDGPVRVAGALSGPLVRDPSRAAFDGRLEARSLELLRYRWESLETPVSARSDALRLDGAELRSPGGGRATLTLDVEPEADAPLTEARVAGEIRGSRLDARRILAAASLPEYIEGRIGGTATIGGRVGSLEVDADVVVEDGEAFDQTFDRLELRGHASADALEARSLSLVSGDGRMQGSGRFSYADRAFRTQLRGAGWRAERLSVLRAFAERVEGRLELDLTAEGVAAAAGSGRLLERIQADGRWRLSDLRLAGRPMGEWSGAVTGRGDAATVGLAGAPFGGRAEGSSTLSFADGRFGGRVSFNDVDLAALAVVAGREVEGLQGAVDGSADFAGELDRPDALTAEGVFDRLELALAEIPGARRGYQVWNPFPMYWSFAERTLELQHMRLQGEDTDFEVDGDVVLGEDAQLDVTLDGELNLALLGTLYPDWQTAGRSTINVKLTGDVADPNLAGAVMLRDGSLRSEDFPNGLSAIEGEIELAGRQVEIEQITAVSGGGRLSLSGVADFSGGGYEFRLNAEAERVRMRYPENLSSVVDGSLVYTGADGRSLLTGEIQVSRLAPSPEVGLGELLASLREPIRTPPSSPLLRNLQFNVHVASQPNMEVETAMMRNVSALIDLRLVGAVTSPSLLGRVVVNEGSINFHGSRYTINRGEIQFLNPFRIEPSLDFEIETRIRDVDIALVLSGPARKLNVSYRSDPPLSFSDLVNLVAVGRDPTFDPLLASQQRVQQQSLFQTGANNVFSNAVERPVSPGLQRFFGVSRLKVDPEVGGAEANPAARISTEQPITNEVTLIYTYDLSSAQRQTFRLEYAPDKRWTFTLTRDQNGLVGSDVIYKKRLR